MIFADKVEDEEVLYRSVSVGCFVMSDGVLRLTSTAFNDPTRRPSVDRAKLCGANPASTRKRLTDGVVSLAALSVREIANVVQNDKHGQPVLPYYQVDVIPDPVKDHAELPDNPAHGLIVACPDIDNDRVFKRLKESLARIAETDGWLLEPSLANLS